jgi:hypothetical protein
LELTPEEKLGYNAKEWTLNILNASRWEMRVKLMLLLAVGLAPQTTVFSVMVKLESHTLPIF